MTDTEGSSMTRRSALVAATAGAGIAALGTSPAAAQSNARKTFVLIHGAWHGGWCWRRVADLLEAKGHKVFAPTLTGNADRSHLLSKVSPSTPTSPTSSTCSNGKTSRTPAWWRIPTAAGP